MMPIFCVHVASAGRKSHCISAWLPQLHFFLIRACLCEAATLLLSLSFQKREVSPLTFSEEATNQVHVDCVRTSVPARPPVTLPVYSQLHRPTDLTTDNKRLDITLTLWDCLRPFFLPFLFSVVVSLVSSLPSHHSREESDQSLKLSRALGVGLSGGPHLWETC